MRLVSNETQIAYANRARMLAAKHSLWHLVLRPREDLPSPEEKHKSKICSPIRTDCCILASFAWSMMGGKYLFPHKKRQAVDSRKKNRARERKRAFYEERWGVDQALVNIFYVLGYYTEEFRTSGMYHVMIHGVGELRVGLSEDQSFQMPMLCAVSAP